MIKFLKKLFGSCDHDFSGKLTVSGYGYTEYEVWFCKRCPKVFGKQTKNFN
jgi:hypothetical protein